MNKLNKNIVISSIVISVLAWLYAIFMYGKLPDKIVGHMNFNGNVSRYDDKSSIWFILILTSALIYGIYFMAKKQSKYSNNKLKDPQKTKTATLITMPYIAIIQFVLVNLIINKSININFNDNWFMYFFVGFTLLYLIITFTFIYKNIES